MQGAGRSVKRSFRDEEWVGREGFIKEVKSVGLGEQLSVQIETTGESRTTPLVLGN